MSKKESVAIIDYGIGNLYSVSKAFERIGANSVITSNPKIILESSRVVLPGVGAFKRGMDKLSKAGLVEIVREVGASGKPLLGICLGAQLLLDQSEEFGDTAGLGLIKGNVIAIPHKYSSEQMIRVPHIGWNNMLFPHGVASLHKTVLEGIPERSMTYFVHSFMMNPEHLRDRLAEVDYHGVSIAAVINSKNVSGTQFHPEKSGELGLQVLRNFIRY